MSDSSVVIVKGDPREPEIIPVMHRMGTIIPLFPKRQPLSGSHEEALDRARIWLKQNPTFAAKWAGYYLATMRVDGQFEIGAP